MQAPASFEVRDEIEIARHGVFPNAAAGVDQVFDAIGFNTLVASFDAKAYRPNFPGLLIDFDHFSYDTSKPSNAAGWSHARPGSLRIDGDRLLLKSRWTDEGAEALRTGRYRLCSPVFNRCEQLGGKRVRPIELESVALTNQPNMRGMEPIANRLIFNRELTFTSPRSRVGGEPLTLQSLCNAHRVMAQSYQKKFNRTFDDAWNRTRSYYSVLDALMRVPEPELKLLLNRDGQPAIGPYRAKDDPEAQERFWAAVEKIADDVRDRYFSKSDWDGSAGSTAAWNGTTRFYAPWKKLKAKHGAGADPDFLWSELRRLYPKEWADYVLHHAHHQGIV